MGEVRIASYEGSEITMSITAVQNSRNWTGHPSMRRGFWTGYDGFSSSCLLMVSKIKRRPNWFGGCPADRAAWQMAG